MKIVTYLYNPIEHELVWDSTILSYIIYILLPLTPHQSLSKHFNTSSQLIQPPRWPKKNAFHWNPCRTPQSLSQLSLAHEMFAKLLGVSDLENCSYMLYLIYIYIYHIIYISHYNHYISHHPTIIYNQCLKVKRLAISYDHQMYDQFVYKKMIGLRLQGCARMCKQLSISAAMWPRGIGGQHVSRTKSMEYQECRFLMLFDANRSFGNDVSTISTEIQHLRLTRPLQSIACVAPHRCLATVRCTFRRAAAMRIESRALCSETEPRNLYTGY